MQSASALAWGWRWLFCGCPGEGQLISGSELWVPASSGVARPQARAQPPPLGAWAADPRTQGPARCRSRSGPHSPRHRTAALARPARAGTRSPQTEPGCWSLLLASLCPVAGRATQIGFRREGLNREFILDLQHELLPGPGGFTAAALGFPVVVVAEPDRGGQLRNRADEPEIRAPSEVPVLPAT